MSVPAIDKTMLRSSVNHSSGSLQHTLQWKARFRRHQCLADSVISGKSCPEERCILLASNVFYPPFNKTLAMGSSRGILDTGNTSNCDTQASQL